MPDNNNLTIETRKRTESHKAFPLDHMKINIVLYRGEDQPMSINRNFGICTGFGEPPTKEERQEIREMFQYITESFDEIDSLGL